VNGQELPAGKATVMKGELVTDLGAYQLRTFAIKLERRAQSWRRQSQRPLRCLTTFREQR